MLKQEEDFSIKEEHSIQDQFVNTFDHNKWLKMGLKFTQKENLPPVYKIDDLIQKSSLKGGKVFDYFIAKLKQWNSKAKNSKQYDKRDAEVLKFVHAHLQRISRKPNQIQQTLLDNLLNWYQQNINPKPKINDILRNLKRKKIVVHSTEQQNIRKTFNSNLSLKQQLDKEESIIFIEDRHFYQAFNKQQCLQQRLTRRIKNKQQYNLRTWRQQKQINSLIRETTQYRTKREQRGHCALSTYRKSVSSNCMKRPKTQGSGRLIKKVSQQNRASSITGLTLMINPFEVKKK